MKEKKLGERPAGLVIYSIVYYGEFLVNSKWAISPLCEEPKLAELQLLQDVCSHPVSFFDLVELIGRF
jgi:hypothetical protein